MKLTELTYYIYEVGNCKKDLHLRVTLDEFDSSKLSLVEDKLNPDNFRFCMKVFSFIHRKAIC